MNPYLSIGLVLIGAAAAVGPNLLLERVKNANARRVKWDEQLLDYSASFAESAREFLHVASLNRSGTRAAVDDAHRALRLGFERLRLLGSDDVVQAAFAVRRHAYAVRQQFEGAALKREDDYLAQTPAEATRSALESFYAPVRSQLGLRPSSDPQWTSPGRA